MSTTSCCVFVPPLAAAVLLAAAAPASAQNAKSRKPARKTPSAATLAAPEALPPPPGTTRIEPPPPSVASRVWTVETMVGPAIWLGASSLGAAPELRIDAFTPLAAPSPRLGLEGGVSVTFANWFASTATEAPSLPGYPGVPGYPGTIAGLPANTITRSAFMVEIVPTGRLLFELAPRATLYTAGGLGLAEVVASTTEDMLFFGKQETRDINTALVVRLGLGLAYAMNERLRLTVEPVGLDLHVGSNASAFSLLVGASYRL